MVEAEIIAPRLVEQGERMPIRLRLLFERSLPFCFPTPVPPWRVVRLDTEEVVRLRAETVSETYRCSAFFDPPHTSRRVPASRERASPMGHAGR